VFLVVWHPPLRLFCSGDSASCYAASDIALQVFSAHKLPHCNKEEMPQRGGGGSQSVCIKCKLISTVIGVLEFIHGPVFI
jgi:hypothetical protein